MWGMEIMTRWGSTYEVIKIDNKDKILCDYNCGNLANYLLKFKNISKYCCKEYFIQCNSITSKNLPKQHGHYTLYKKIDTDKICSFGCNKKANFKLKNGRYCCSDHFSKCEGYENPNQYIPHNNVSLEDCFINKTGYIIIKPKNFESLERSEKLYNIKLERECWEWIRYKDRDGYGAHKLSYKLFKGEIEKGKCVCHHCDDPSCVNPNHLYLATIGQNNTDRRLKGRKSKGKMKWIWINDDGTEIKIENLDGHCRELGINPDLNSTKKRYRRI